MTCFKVCFVPVQGKKNQKFISRLTFYFIVTSNSKQKETPFDVQLMQHEQVQLVFHGKKDRLTATSLKTLQRLSCVLTLQKTQTPYARVKQHRLYCETVCKSWNAVTTMDAGKMCSTSAIPSTGTQSVWLFPQSCIVRFPPKHMLDKMNMAMTYVTQHQLCYPILNNIL